MTKQELFTKIDQHFKDNPSVKTRGGITNEVLKDIVNYLATEIQNNPGGDLNTNLAKTNLAIPISEQDARIFDATDHAMIFHALLEWLISFSGTGALPKLRLQGIGNILGTQDIDENELQTFGENGIKDTTKASASEKLLNVDTEGNHEAKYEVVSNIMNAAARLAMSNGAFWQNKIYIGPVQNVEVGQEHYDDNYYYRCVASNQFIRLSLS